MKNFLQLYFEHLYQELQAQNVIELLKIYFSQLKFNDFFNLSIENFLQYNELVYNLILEDKSSG